MQARWGPSGAALLVLGLVPLLVAGAASPRVYVETAEELWLAGNDTSVTEIVIIRNLTLTNETWPAGQVIEVSQRSVTLTSEGEVTFNSTSRTLTVDPDVSTLDFGGLWPVFLVVQGGTLVLSNIHIANLASRYLPAVVGAAMVRPLQSNVFPTLYFMAGSLMVYDSTVIDTWRSDCSYAARQADVLRYTQLYGPSNVGLFDGSSIFMLGGTRVTIQMGTSALRPIAGEYTYIQMDGSFQTCVLDPYQLSPAAVPPPPGTAPATSSLSCGGLETCAASDAGASHTASHPSPASSIGYETWMVLELCDRGSLETVIRKRRFVSAATGRVMLKPVLYSLRDMARGMAYLHAHNIVHGDLKAANVLLKSAEGSSNGYVAKIADFGLSQMMDPGQTRTLMRTMGSVGYMPPEAMKHGHLTKATDIYSAGILAWELITSTIAFAGMTAAQVFFCVLTEGYQPPIPDTCPPALASLIRDCLQREPSARPSFDSIVVRVEAMLADL
ncbi:Serine/threonine-protein kinase HT1 [Auxenochlorella protothecoides]|uniref:Serine/threonine-protein kinase HT1 n=1 Tax=Auxenochlorella protothecoides TaxID=3075 RepID=A0A087SJ78_AUXPR|nr:Serine/threonine-protein kinase HT1 [Auxenochlorella protothecoides]KFM25782.1 Serine/threonine-protein kinase HT1 [Auxenochlorella protothecoides]